MTASSRQKKTKQLIVKLRVRQLEQELKQELEQELKQELEQELEQKLEQEQRNNGISTNDQLGRGMRIRRAPKRSY